jgi:hypothetical protein
MARTREDELKEVPLWTANKQAWPPGVRTIGQDELDCLGVDRRGNLYWDGKPVEVRHFSLTLWQKVGAVIIAGSDNADQSFCGDVSDGRTRRAQLQDASNRQANDDESTDQHKDRGQSAFAGETWFAHSGTEPSRSGSGWLLHSNFTPANCVKLRAHWLSG